MAVDIGEDLLRAGEGAFLPGDHAHPSGPVAQVEQGGDLRGPRAVARLSVGVDRRDPGAFLDGVDGGLEVGEESRESQRVRKFLVEEVGECLGAAGGVGADQDPAPPGRRIAANGWAKPQLSRQEL